ALISLGKIIYARVKGLLGKGDSDTNTGIGVGGEPIYTKPPMDDDEVLREVWGVQ
ncbi:unnamed protein product, partial [marine sediment metagenome]